MTISHPFAGEGGKEHVAARQNLSHSDTIRLKTCEMSEAEKIRNIIFSSISSFIFLPLASEELGRYCFHRSFAEEGGVGTAVRS